jgi:hypothetical protein
LGVGQHRRQFFRCRHFSGACEIVSADQKEPALSVEALDDMAKHGITRITVDYFMCGEYRYTNLKDAIAQAKRQRSAAG